MRVSELGEQLLICEDVDAKSVLPPKILSKQVGRFKGVHIFDIGSDVRELYEGLNEIPDMLLNRYLDKFHLLTPKGDTERQQKVIDSFFELIANEYECLIDVERNLDNIRNLLQFIRDLVDSPEGSAFVDYGCGTGLAVQLAHEFNMTLIGVDSCPTMRRIARSRGMITLSAGELARKPSNSIPGAFASYVFHVLAQTHGLRLLWARLKPEGIIVANFHKNQGIEMIDNCVRDLQGSIQYLDSPIGSERHGAYIAYFKKE